MTVTMIKMRTQVKEASCYGNLANCEAPAQKCCKTTYERVCQQVCSFYDVKWNYGKKSYSLYDTNWMACMYRAAFNWSHFALLVNTVRRSTRKLSKVPTRVPVVVNMTIAGRPMRKQDCQMVERTIPRCSRVEIGKFFIPGNWQIEKFKGIGHD